MAVDSEPNEGSRKTLDEIRRELDAEYGFVEAEPRALDVREAPDGADRAEQAPDEAQQTADVRRPHERPIEAGLFRARTQAPRSRAWDDGDEVSDERVEQLFERHRLAMGRRADDDERPRRSGYLLAALIGCFAGQALLLGFFLVTQHRLSADLLRTSVAVSPRVEATEPAPPPAAPAATEESAPLKAESAPPKEEIVQSIVSIPPDPEPPAATAAEPPTYLPPRTTTKANPQPSPTSPARPPRIRDANDVAEAQVRLRSALNEWLRTSARGGAPVQSTEPVIVLGPDGRTAKTYLSIASPIGLIPREQHWQLGTHGWYVVEDRQAGLPRPGFSRER
jgi:hypothetical protein